MLTLSLTAIDPKTVTRSVSGMRYTAKGVGGPGGVQEGKDDMAGLKVHDKCGNLPPTCESPPLHFPNGKAAPIDGDVSLHTAGIAAG